MTRQRAESTILKEIAETKEERSRTLIRLAPPDNVAAAEGHADVVAFDGQLKELMAELYEARERAGEGE